MPARTPLDGRDKRHLADRFLMVAVREHRASGEPQRTMAQDY